MRKILCALLVAGLTMAACDEAPGSTGAASSSVTSSGNGRNGVGVVLPDSASSPRWKIDHPRALAAAFQAAGVPYEIQNAEGDKAVFQAIAARMIDSGVKVLMIANLDSVSAKAVIANAKAHRVPVIDYDRLTLNGGADYYVSYDNVAIGVQQANGLISCLRARRTDQPVVAELHGSPTDNNTTLFKDGYDSVLRGRYDSGEFVKGPDQFVPAWDPDEGKAIFTQMLRQWPKISGVVAANDNLANAVIQVLRAAGLNGKVPVTGQDATVQGLRNILTGDQCMTVYKSAKAEADAAAELAIGLVRGEKKPLTGKVKDPGSGAYVPAVLLSPTLVTARTIRSTVLRDRAVTAAEICTGAYLVACREHGVVD
ncbi:D-xylose transport system substrate-binding protein [Actinoplanes octamycinicus]|uniref:D-xylose transport system substrate-binding protein n=1 Tax=Actinoplanes octamycinicus TaxID=135948 RepID=A0A7W7GXW4_9ACTN|nr:substrate-binding domain-containing protein [Actinoplanes octamycinicus]MBB4740324.1 D-xylose transport system substrate-binding protein [Actinoplanes octamycinicus]GIE62600.1 sugar ABC transporter substrate-binding protein [Actinoplanes octamycinicus]